MLSTQPVIEESLQHGKNVAKYAMILFNGLKSLHKLSDEWGHILDKGAELHDIGWIYGKRAHHKASAAMIRAGHVELVPKNIRHFVAMVARYHRRAEPSQKHWRFAALKAKEQEAMLYLASIIRLADALDFSHSSCVQNIRVEIEKDLVKLKLQCKHNCQAEIDRVQTKKELFVRIFKHDVQAYLT